jgi:hypothetical protein
VAASSTSRRRRGRISSAATKQASATRPTKPVSRRLPNSIHWCSAATSGCGCGTKLPGKHCGQVGQPRPEPVTRTTEPVTAIPPWVITAAIAILRDRLAGTR